MDFGLTHTNHRLTQDDSDNLLAELAAWRAEPVGDREIKVKGEGIDTPAIRFVHPVTLETGFLMLQTSGIQVPPVLDAEIRWVLSILTTAGSSRSGFFASRKSRGRRCAASGDRTSGRLAWSTSMTSASVPNKAVSILPRSSGSRAPQGRQRRPPDQDRRDAPGSQTGCAPTGDRRRTTAGLLRGARDRTGSPSARGGGVGLHGAGQGAPEVIDRSQYRGSTTLDRAH